jgi:cytochrome c
MVHLSQQIVRRARNLSAISPRSTRAATAFARQLRAATFVAIAAVCGWSGAASAQDAGAGEQVFGKCKACHQVGEGAKSLVGPELNGVVGRKAAVVQGYAYSSAMRNTALAWDEATLTDYLKDPKVKVPGTKMVFPGLSKPSEILNVITYLKQFSADGKKS